MSIVISPGLGIGLRGYWHFDESYLDQTENKNHLAAVASPVFVSSKFGSGVDLEVTSSQYLNLSDAGQTGLDITGDLSIVAIIKPESVALASTILSKYDSTSGNNRGYRFFLTTSSFLSFAVSSDGTNANTTTAEDNVALANGTLYVVAVTYNAAAGTCQFYIDGTATTSGASLKTSIFDTPAAFGIGARDISSPIEFFDGVIDEALIWARNLTAAEITELSTRYQRHYAFSKGRMTFVS